MARTPFEIVRNVGRALSAGAADAPPATICGFAIAIMACPLGFKDGNRGPENVTRVLAGDRPTVTLKDRLDDDAGLSQLMNIATPARNF
jgi:hypothetical protein